MKKTFLFLIIFFLLLACHAMSHSEFIIVNKAANVDIYVDEHSDELIKWAANDLAEDFGNILGTEISINYTDKMNPDTKGIYIGKFDDTLIKNLPENYIKQLQNRWERFVIKNHGNNLFIVGSDIRGTVYGIFDVAERTGISPWKW